MPSWPTMVASFEPSGSVGSLGAMVVFTSGIVDDHACLQGLRVVLGGLVVTRCLTLVGDGVKHTVGS
jgi:hypothetical protein